jgi:DNA repair exonuclease SbcCD ATPase subunit
MKLRQRLGTDLSRIVLRRLLPAHPLLLAIHFIVQRRASGRPGLPVLPLAIAIALAIGLPGLPGMLASEATDVSLTPRNGREDPVTNKPPLSTIVEIQDHGERFFDETDAAAAALNRIGDQDDVWKAARDAKAQADAKPGDNNAQQAYRAARARFLHQRILIFLDVLKFELVVRQAYEAFCSQLDMEIEAVKKQAETEKAAVSQHASQLDKYLNELHQVRARIDGAKDLDPQDVDLMKEIEREVKNLENHKMLATDRELLAAESLRDLEQSRSQAEQHFAELQDEFTQARSDASLLQEIARNDLMNVTHEQRRELLERFKKRQPITPGKSRKVVEELVARIRQRQDRLATQSPLIEGRVEESRKHVDEFLKSLPPPKSTPQEASSAPGKLTKN